MTNELRCPAKLKAVVISDDVIEVACNSRFCGAGQGVVVRHRFQLSTRRLLSTRRYRSPIKPKKG